MEFKVGTSIKKDKTGEALLYFIFEDEHDLSQLDEETKNYIGNVTKYINLKGKLNEVKLLFPMNKNFKAICLAGLGKKNDYKPDNLRQSAASAAKLLKEHEITKFSVMLKNFPEGFDDTIPQSIVEGSILGTYIFTKKTDLSSLKKPLESMTGVTEKRLVKKVIKDFDKGKIVADAVCFARDLANIPAEEMTPVRFGEVAIERLKNLDNVSVEVLDKKKLMELEMGGLLAVNKGSFVPPVFVVVKYNGGKQNEKPLAFIGKGITFDSGGIDLKSWRELHEMKFDMCGAADVLAAIDGIAKLKIKRNIVGLIPLTENMIAGDAQKAGDIIKMYNKKTVEYINTDAEGRILLADAFSYSANFNPKALVSLSTLTGSCKIAIGTYCAAILCPDEDLKNRVIKTGKKVEELCWELPLMPQFDKMLESRIADIANIPLVNDAMTSIGGVFLKNFAPNNVPWAHVDICATANGVKNIPYIQEDASGWGVRLLIKLSDDWV